MSEKGALLGVAAPPKAPTRGPMKRNAVYTMFYLVLVGYWVYLVRGYMHPRIYSRPIDSELTASDSEDVCLSPSCVHAASEILYNLSPNYKELDPCTDFEELVCGGWRERHDLRPDQGAAFTGTIMSENSQLLLRHILEAPYPNVSGHSSFSPMRLAATTHSADEANFEKLTSAYNACLDEKTIEKLGNLPLASILDQIRTSFPVTTTQPINAFAETILLLAKYGVSALVSTGASADDADPDVVVVSVSAPWRIGLPAKERYEDDALVKKYQAVIVETLGKLVPGQTKDVLEAVVGFEKKLAAASPNNEDRQDVTKYYNPMSLKDASALTPKIDLARVIAGLSGGQDVNRLIVGAPQYLKDLQTILEETDQAVLQNYFSWKAVQAFYPYVSSLAVKPYKRFVNELAGKVRISFVVLLSPVHRSLQYVQPLTSKPLGPGIRTRALAHMC